MKEWFSVSKEGLRKQVESQPKGKLIAELVQNAFDEDGVTEVKVDIRQTENAAGRLPFCRVRVEDDSPEGFRDLGHAYTLFAESYKKADPKKRGQFNIGEKMVLALCRTARISTTKGTVYFTDEGRKENTRTKRERGSVFEGELRSTVSETEDAIKFLREYLLVPEGIKLILNGEILSPKKPLKIFTTPLETVIADAEGIMRPTTRTTEIEIFHAPASGGWIYEMGIPIVETGDKYHINVGQKVLLNKDRDNVAPRYLKALRTFVFNHTFELVEAEDVNSAWVREATSDKRVDSKAFRHALDLRFGEKRASFDPRDPEANMNATSQGFTVITGRMLSKAEWAKAKETETIRPASFYCPTPKVWSDDPNSPLAQWLPPEEYTEGMRHIVEYSRFLAKELLGRDISVKIIKYHPKARAFFGPDFGLGFTLNLLGKAWFDSITEDTDSLILHEFGHQFKGNHLDDSYHEALSYLGAKFVKLALEKPDALLAYRAKKF